MKNSALLALTAAATALPGIAQAQQIAEQFEFGVRHHAYDEEPISASETLSPQLDRYDIDVNQFRLVAPLSENWQLNLDYQRETMSGASPWYTFQLPGEGVKQIMSGASIEDTRTDVSASATYAWDRKGITFGIATSDEDDYESTSASLAYSFESEDRLRTYSFSTDYSDDEVSPVDADIFLTRPTTTQDKESYSFLFSLSQILNKNSIAKFSVSVARKKGYLSDPYKLVFVDNNLIGDSRPDQKTSKTFAVQYRYFADELNGALHADYRYYDDNWDISSNTLKLAWYQNLGMGFQLVPSIRWYSQDEAYFYQTFYTDTRDDGFYSTDYRLSEYGATTYGLKLSKRFDNWSLSLSAEKYESGGSDVLADASIENPGLLDFDLITFGFDIYY
ncbi:MAG: DUF3570 domain-containing protein [Aestuariibacter sp.]